jgi:hypothetical protein
MTGPFPITPSPSQALDNVKPDGLIPPSKELYLPALAFGRSDKVSVETFFVGARSVTKGLERIAARGLGDDLQKRGWIG